MTSMEKWKPKRTKWTPENFDLHEWLIERKEVTGHVEDLKYFAERWGCSVGFISRWRSGEKMIPTSFSSAVFNDLPISESTYYNTVWPRMHAQFVRRAEALQRWAPHGFDPCRKCGEAFEMHENPNVDTYKAGPCPATGCLGYERWVRRGKAREGDTRISQRALIRSRREARKAAQSE